MGANKKSSNLQGNGICTCRNYVGGSTDDYCQDWHCESIAVASCPSTSTDCGQLIRYGSYSYYNSCCGAQQCDANGQNCYTPQTLRAITMEWQDCMCTGMTNISGVNHCLNWYCLDHHGSKLEYVNYQCNTFDPTGYCSEYQASTDNSYVWFNTDCTCEDYGLNNSYSYCSKYTCIENGQLKMFPNLGFIALGICLGIPWLLLIDFVTDPSCNCGCSPRVLTGIFTLLYLVFAFITTLSGGIASLLISQACNAGLFAIIHYYNFGLTCPLFGRLFPNNSNNAVQVATSDGLEMVPAPTSKFEENVAAPIAYVQYVPVPVQVPVPVNITPNQYVATNTAPVFVDMEAPPAYSDAFVSTNGGTNL